MPIAAMSVAVRLALRSASDATLDCEAQISLASCSTQPGRGNIWRNSCCATATIAPWWSKTMARELVVPWSSARICFIGGSSLPAKLEKLRADHTADDGPDDRHPGVAPVARALAGDGQKRVDEPRSEIARRIDCVAGGTAERESDREHQQSDEQWREAFFEAAVRHQVFRTQDRKHTRDEDGGADDFRQQVGERAADGRAGAEDSELATLVGRRLPVRKVRDPDDHASEKCAEELG